MNNEIDLWSLLKFYGKYWYVIFILAGAGLVVGFVYNTFIQTPLYKSDATVTFINNSNQASARTVRDISNYADLVTSRSVLNKAIESSHEDITYSQLAASTSVANDKNTDVIGISVTTPNPYRSAALAQGITNAFETEVVSVYNLPEDEVRVIDTAQRATEPVNVRKNLQLLLSTGVGFVLALIVLFFALDLKNSRPRPQDRPDGSRDEPHVTPTQKPQKTVPEDAMDLPEDFFTDIAPKKPSKRAVTHPPQKPGSKYAKRTI